MILIIFVKTYSKMHVLIKKLKDKDGEFTIEDEGISIEEIRSFRRYKLTEKERNFLKEQGCGVKDDEEITYLYMQPQSKEDRISKIKVVETIFSFAKRIGALGPSTVTVAGG